MDKGWIVVGALMGLAFIVGGWLAWWWFVGRKKD
jgi:hypothetical protein